VIDSPHGNTSYGKCKRCGAVAEFSNTLVSDLGREKTVTSAPGMKAVTILTVVLIGLLWTFGLATLMVVHYFAALFNDYQVLITINEYGEYVYETPLIILAWPIMLFSTVFCMRLVTRIARVIDLPLKNRSSYNVRLGTEEVGLEWSKEATDNAILKEAAWGNS